MSLFSVGHFNEITGSKGVEQVRNPYAKQQHVQSRLVGQPPSDRFVISPKTEAEAVGKTMDSRVLTDLKKAVPAVDRNPMTITQLEDKLSRGEIKTEKDFNDSMIRNLSYVTGTCFHDFVAHIYFDDKKNNRAVFIKNKTDNSSLGAYLMNDNSFLLYRFNGVDGKQMSFSYMGSEIGKIPENIKTMPINKFTDEALRCYLLSESMRF